MAEVDTSSYPKAGMPVSPLDVAQKYGAVQQQQLGISQAKLDQANQGLTYLTRAMASIGPNPGPDWKQKYMEVGANAVKMGLVPAESLQTWSDRVQQAPDSDTFFNQTVNAAQSHQQILQNYRGTPGQTTDSANVYQGTIGGLTSQNPGGFQRATQMPVQLPPTTPTVDTNPTLPNGQPNPNFNQPGYLGASGPPGAVQSPQAGRLPVAPLNAPAATPSQPISPVAGMAPAGPIAGVAGKSGNFGGKVVGANAEPPTLAQRFNDAFPNRVASGAAPGVAGAQEIVGKQSGTDFAAAKQRAGTIAQDLQPDLAILDIVKGKPNNAFGPGTSELNQLKKLAVTWLPGENPKTIEDTKDFDTVKKYLIQGARSSADTGSDNRLAATFEGSPNTTMNSATIETLVKTRVALKKMEAAQTLLAIDQGVRPDQFSDWKAKNQNVLDSRAFGFDMMNADARKKLVSSLSPAAYKKFEYSLEFANKAKLISPPGM